MGQGGTVSTITGSGGGTGVATTTGNPMETPKRTPALADMAAAPTSAAKRSILIFIVLILCCAFVKGGLIINGIRPFPR
jgi:hypothetical protein